MEDTDDNDEEGGKVTPMMIMLIMMMMMLVMMTMIMMLVMVTTVIMIMHLPLSCHLPPHHMARHMRLKQLGLPAYFSLAGVNIISIDRCFPECFPLQISISRLVTFNFVCQKQFPFLNVTLLRTQTEAFNDIVIIIQESQKNYFLQWIQKQLCFIKKTFVLIHIPLQVHHDGSHFPIEPSTSLSST